jgi:hypothetical protein
MRRHVNAEAILGIIGVLLLLIAWLTADTGERSKFSSQAFAQVGFTILTVAVLSWLWKTLGGEPTTLAIEKVEQTVTTESAKSSEAIRSSLSESANDLKSTVDNALSASLDVLKSSSQVMQDNSDSVLTRIVTNSSNFDTNRDWMRLLMDTNDCVDLIGYTLNVWMSNAFIDESVRLVQRGVIFRLLIMHPDNPFFEVFINSQFVREVNPGKLKGQDTLKTVNCIQSKIDDKAKFEVRSTRNGIVTAQICRFDRRMTVIPYFWSRGANESPLLMLSQKDKGLFASYEREFNSIWRSNEPA